MGKEKNFVTEAQEETLYLYIYGEGRDTYTLYEDDGKSLDYQQGKCAFTEIVSEVTDTTAHLHLAPAKGSFDGMAKTRKVVAVRKGLCKALAKV